VAEETEMEAVVIILVEVAAAAVTAQGAVQVASKEQTMKAG